MGPVAWYMAEDDAVLNGTVITQPLHNGPFYYIPGVTRALLSQVSSRV